MNKTHPPWQAGSSCTTRLTQAAIWQAIRAHMPDVKWDRIESSVNRGIPDLHGLYRGVSIFIEIKSVEKNGAIQFQPGQVHWHTSYAAHGGRSYIVAACRAWCGVWRGVHARHCQQGKEGAALCYPWPPPWEQLRDALFRLSE